ncbi:MAG: UDP-glucuronic acid decarboxylase family protein [Candidatus Hadarchaeota archaeon]
MARKKTAVVTGGSGFIGSWVCERLLQDGFGVICVDNISSGNRRNIAHLRDNENFEFMEQDVREPMNIRARVDTVFHLSSRASPVDFVEHAVEILMTNSTGTRNSLELARKNKARFLLASSSEVYGNPLEHPQRETYWGNVNPNGVRSSYDESKRFSEALTSAYVRNHGLDARIARIFNTYGPRMRKDDGRVIPNFTSQALSGRPITVYGDGSHSRAFCYVEDLVDGLVRLAFKGGLKGEVVNVGNPREVKVLEVAKLVKKITGTKSEIVFKPLPKDDPVRRRPDISKARRLLKWEPKVPLEAGLQKTIEYFKKFS